MVPLPHPPLLLCCLIMQSLSKVPESICAGLSQSFLLLRKEGAFVLWVKTCAQAMGVSLVPGHPLQNMGPAARISDQGKIGWTNLQFRWRVGGFCKAHGWASVSIVFVNTHDQYLSIRNSYKAKLQHTETLSENFSLVLMNPSKYFFSKILQQMFLSCQSSKVATEIKLKAPWNVTDERLCKL